MKGLTEGRIVHYVLESGSSRGEHRPAIIVKVWNQEPGTCNLVVFVDGSNDSVPPFSSPSPLTQWQTSVLPDLDTKAPGSWHWIEPA